MKNVKNLRLLCLAAILLLVALPTFPAKAQTVDISIKAAIGYPLIDNLPEEGTPPHEVWFGVCVKNEGTVDTSCTVYLFLDTKGLIYQKEIFLEVNEVEFVVYTTDTSFLGKGVHTLIAFALAPGDWDILTGDAVKVGIIADTNYDGIVDIYDVVAVSSRYGMGSVTLDPIWIPEVDVNEDGQIDIYDLTYYAGQGDYYGLTRAYISYGSSGDLDWNWACDLYRDGKIDVMDLSIVSSHYGDTDP